MTLGLVAGAQAGEQASWLLKPRGASSPLAYAEVAARFAADRGLVSVSGSAPGRSRRAALQNTDQAVFSLSADTFATWFGDAVDGKTYRGVTAAPEGSAFVATTTTSDAGAGQQFAAALGGFTGVAATRLAPAPLAPLAGPDALAGGIGDSLRPRTALPARLRTVVRGADAAVAALVRTRRLRPVLAHPRFPDPLFEPLRQLGQDYVLPNIADLPPESIAVMEPNGRFIEAVMAGASTELARELLWNEFPTDQRGTYFSRFWDARDAGADAPPPDIRDLADWTGQLGEQSGRAGGLLVLVVRAELLVKFPNTVVFAQHGTYVSGGRTLDDAGDDRNTRCCAGTSTPTSSSTGSS